MSSAVVVGSGPNGLACAAALAREGVDVTVLEADERIGGGARTGELTIPGLLHDECSAIHPMGSGSPCFRGRRGGRRGGGGGGGGGGAGGQQVSGRAQGPKRPGC